jgi:hypothetical protein
MIRLLTILGLPWKCDLYGFLAPVAALSLIALQHDGTREDLSIRVAVIVKANLCGKAFIKLKPACDHKL